MKQRTSLIPTLWHYFFSRPLFVFPFPSFLTTSIVSSVNSFSPSKSLFLIASLDLPICSASSVDHEKVIQFKRPKELFCCLYTCFVKDIDCLSSFGEQSHEMKNWRRNMEYKGIKFGIKRPQIVTHYMSVCWSISPSMHPALFSFDLLGLVLLGILH